MKALTVLHSRHSWLKRVSLGLLASIGLLGQRRLKSRWLAAAAGLLLLMTSQTSFALSCLQSGTSNPVINQQIPSNIAVPADAANGTIIWESPQYSITIYCYKDFGADVYDEVRMYINPANQQPAAGAIIGVKWNGTLYQQSSGSVSVNQALPNGVQSLTFSLTFSVVLIKSGASPASGSSSFSNFRVFQLDGSGGLNINPNANLNFDLTGTVRFIGCFADLTFSPSSTVDFGSLPATGNVGAVAGSRSVALTGSRACTSPYKLGIAFVPSSPATLADTRTWDLGNGMGVNIVDQQSNAVLLLDGTSTDFVDLMSVVSRSHSYTVQLKRLLTNGTVGPFSGALAITLTYM
ncbi:fimbrial protein [Caballeronia grimmiae]|nr:fimbrial protein [Caballeronia grimmiae]